MTWRTGPVSDDELDQTIAVYLRWRASQLDGAPDAGEMAWRIAGSRGRGRPRWMQATAVLAMAALLILATSAVVVVASRPPGPLGPLVNGPIVIVNALGWRAIDPLTGAESTFAACDGQCPGAISLVATADGRTVFYIVPTRIDGEGRPAAPGWGLWRWDRAGGSTQKVRACDACLMYGPVPAPDGRSVAYIETPRAKPGALVDAVVISADTGREIRRIGDVAPYRPAWDARGRLLLMTGEPGDFGHRRVDLATGTDEVLGEDLPDGLLTSSPDGRHLVLFTPSRPSNVDFHVVDPDLEHARLLVGLDDVAQYRVMFWTPDGSAFVAIIRDVHTDVADPTGEVRSYDLATGAMVPRGRAIFSSDLLWLPADEPSDPAS